MAGTVLVVDDDGDLRETIAETLREGGFSVVEARDGAEALRVLDERADVGLVLLDLMMPVMSGWELLERLRARPGGSPPVVVTTAAGFYVPGVSVLRKPFELDDLLALVRRFLVPAGAATS